MQENFWKRCACAGKLDWMDRKQIKTWLLLIGFGVVLFTVLQNFDLAWQAVKKLLWIVEPVITGFCIAFVLNVLLRVLENRVFCFLGNSENRWARRLMRPISLAATILLTLGFVTLLLLVIIPELQKTILSLLDNLERYISSIQGWISSIEFNGVQLFQAKFDWDKFFATVQEFLTSDTSADLMQTAAGVTTSVISTVMNLFFSFFISIYVLAQKERIGRFAARLSAAILPAKVSDRVSHICSVAYNSFSNFITGQLTEAVILGLLCCVGMLIFQFPNAAIISILIGVTALVPVVGPLIGEIVGCLLILMVNPLKALLFLIFVLALQVLEGNLIYPKVVGKSVGLPGLLVLIAVVVGSNVGGMLGVLLGVPVASVVYTLVLDWLDSRRQAPAPKDAGEKEGPPVV